MASISSVSCFGCKNVITTPAIAKPRTLETASLVLTPLEYAKAAPAIGVVARDVPILNSAPYQTGYASPHNPTEPPARRPTNVKLSVSMGPAGGENSEALASTASNAIRDFV